MLVTAWTNSTFEKRSSGFGLKIQPEDRDMFFCKTWKHVIVKLPNGKEVLANIDKPSFWNNSCRELINVEFRDWFFEHGLAPWEKNKPPKLELTHVSDNKFTLSAGVNR